MDEDKQTLKLGYAIVGILHEIHTVCAGVLEHGPDG